MVTTGLSARERSPLSRVGGGGYPLPPEGYVTDQYSYPIDEDRQPEWLKQRLAEGYAEIRTWDPADRLEWWAELGEKGEAPAWLIA
jgi:hypothetical protein